MKHALILILALAMVVLLVSGCSKEQAPTSSSSETVATDNGPIDVLIGYTGKNAVRTALSASNGVVKREYQNFAVIYASLTAEGIEALKNDPNVRYVEEDILRYPSAQTLDWGVDRVDAEYVWANSSYTGAGIKVAILDSGGDMDHPDLPWAGGVTFVGRNWDDKSGHGTHVAGIIGAADNSEGVVGVAPGCDLWAVKISRSGSFYLSDILDGIDWCVNNGMDIMNMSYGGGYAQSEDDACQAAWNAGLLIVAAAGNGYGADVEYPAALSSVMAISASNASDGLAGFSSHGPEVEVIAPGDNILSTYKGGGYAYMGGTSMSTPMVCGGAALAWSAHPGYSNQQIRNLLKSSAEDIGLPSDDQGSGLLDAEKATINTTNGDDLGGGDPPGGADTMHVESITWANNKKNLNVFVTIHSEDHSTPVSGANVTMTLHHIGGSDYNFGGTTSSSGVIKFTLRGISSGLCFDATVTGVTKSGTTYNSGSNHETTDSYCIP
ncbi:MAG: S8 family serine peptidase [candidate division Zixibacteria bacterium]|nr:S8 family serine peptidase [candidate division Zixibacteria bacterium]MDH3938805.1 S8 family serine peptidase [candidate division Zixibacteria bacterium]MDH4032267.1 S8 family serine peptidase [candidate division Zixibacteria bacterium]